MRMEEYKPILVMVGCQFMYSGVTLSSRAAVVQDFSSKVFVVYRQSIAFLLIAPFAFFPRRETNGCRLGWKSFWLISLLSLVGVTINQNLYLEGLYFSSSSAGSALSNMVPAITFVLAYSLGLEKVEIRKLRSVGKIIGTVMCVSGAVAMALFKGPKLLNVQLLLAGAHQDTWLLGCLFLLGGMLCWSLWLILQAYVSACYSDHLSLTAWMCLFGALQSAIFTLIAEPNIDVWKLTSPLQLFSVSFAGITSAVTFFAQTWCIAKRGPLFSALFNPLATLIVTIFACIFMHEELYTGSLIGGLVLILGLYIVLWGKAKDYEKVEKQSDHNSICSTFDDLEQPLLLDKVSEKKLLA